MRIVYALSLSVLAFQLGSSGDARAQSARRGPYYNRTATTRGHAGMAVERGVGSLDRTSSLSAPNLDPLSPYRSRAATAYSSAPPVARRPMPRPLPQPVPRNYFPSARVGQSMNNNNSVMGSGGRHCTPSRAGSLGR